MSDYKIKLLDPADQTRGFVSIDLHFYNADSTLLSQNNPAIIHTESIAGVVQSGETKTGNLRIIFKSPHAQSTMLLQNDTEFYRIKNIQLQFINENDDSGNFSLYNASLLSSQLAPIPTSSPKRISCFIDEDSLQLQCE